MRWMSLIDEQSRTPQVFVPEQPCCSRLKWVFAQFQAGHKRPPAAHKLLLLKGVARIQTSVKMKSSLYCFPAAVQLRRYVQLIVHVVQLYSVSVHLSLFLCVSMSVCVYVFKRFVCVIQSWHITRTLFYHNTFSVIRLYLSVEPWDLNPAVTPLNVRQLTPQAVH